MSPPPLASLNRNLHTAKNKKDDEFYTQLTDIANELQYYEPHFEGGTVYCNCDDPTVSNFVQYFAQNFHRLKLKRLIGSCYKSKERDMFSRHDSKTAIWYEYNGEKKGNAPSFEGGLCQAKPLQGDGDFRSAECLDLLRQADFVVTNPPFSEFREYVKQLINHGKKFLIIGNKNAISYKEIFPLIKDNCLWIGHTPIGRDLLFDVPSEHTKELIRTKKEGSAYKVIDGVIKRRSQSIWFTNMDHKKRHENLMLIEKYTPEKYPHYDNYDAIEVGEVVNIPKDWDGIMGVPITFLGKFNPDQFEILGLSQKVGMGLESNKKYDEYLEMRPDGIMTGSSGQKTNGNAVLQGKPKRASQNFFVKDGDVVHSLYGRIFIRNKEL
ncbi:MAG: hypothetical protein OXD47_00495 [Gammaproteobacteria bacterium]|nr:hypothetical protein [Gammaproteobacteria bacterium]MCY4210499.1 hypothetical protein [Gammaproteobacteria bacterium]MCY4283482.1 hypothetical protein [Gammaproteobacteria bacterium]MCY4337261.1 hypothetical protein [Gammaproteobacteria bacterium]